MGLHINSLTYVIICMAIGLLVDFLVHIMLRWYETDGLCREEKVKETLRTMGASIFIGGVTTFLGVCPLVLSTTHIFMTVFWAFLAIVALGFTHGLILLPVVLSVIGPTATHHSQSANHSNGGPPGLKKAASSSSSVSSTSSTSSGKAGKFDDDILQSSTEEELEELNCEKERRLNDQRRVPFMGPSYELEAIEEGPESAKSRQSRPNSTTSARSRRSIVPAPSDEMQSLAMVDHAKWANHTLLGQLADAYSCAREFDFYDSVNINACKKPTGISAECGEI